MITSDEVQKMASAKLGLRALSSLMDDAPALNQLILQRLSTSPTAKQIDREVGDLRGDVFGAGAPWLTYLRYDAQLDQNWLASETSMELSEKEVDELRKMDDPSNLDALVHVGQATAKPIDKRNFESKFDI